MKKDTRTHSAIEAFVNTLSGYFLSVFAAHFIFPILGIKTSSTENFQIVALFTIVSVIRNYVIRRFFSKYEISQWVLQKFFKKKPPLIKSMNGVYPDESGNIAISPYTLKDSNKKQSN